MPNIGGLALRRCLWWLWALGFGSRVGVEKSAHGLLEHQDRILEGGLRLVLFPWALLLLALGTWMIVALSCFNQVGCAVLGRGFGCFWVGLRCWSLPGQASRWWFLALIVAVTNAINFIDNMDGLAGGLGFVAAMAFGYAPPEQSSPWQRSLDFGRWFAGLAVERRLAKSS